MAYLAWPIALFDRIAPRGDTSGWYRFQMHQARWFGGLVFLAFLIALSWPLVVSLFVGDVTATLWIYAMAMAIDVALFIGWLVLAIRYSRRAARGELFDVPLVARVTGTRSRKP